MTVSKITPVNNYTGNGSATTFDFDFLIEDESELLVQYTDSDGVQTTLTLDVDYSINEVGNEEGSYITFPLDKSSYGVLTSDEVITLALRLDIEQEKEYANSSKFLNSTLEWSLDYITRILQIMNRYIERCVKIQEGSSDSAEAYFTELLEDMEEIVTAAKSEFESELETYKTEVDTEIAEFESSVNSSVETFETEVNTTLADYKTEVDTEIAEFEENVNSTIDTVTQAAENINELEEAIENASQIASNAEESAAAANETLAELQSFYDSAMADIENLADTSLSNLTQTGENKLNYNVFCVNTGETDDEGNPAFLSISDGVLTTSGEFVVTTAAGKTYTVSDTLTLDISDYEDGTYNIYVNPVDLTLSVIDNTLTAGITFSDDAAEGDYLLNTSKIPYDLQKYTPGDTTITTVNSAEVSYTSSSLESVSVDADTFANAVNSEAGTYAFTCTKEEAEASYDVSSTFSSDTITSVSVDEDTFLTAVDYADGDYTFAYSKTQTTETANSVEVEYSISLEDYTVTSVTVDADTFAEAVSNTEGSYTFYYDCTTDSWTTDLSEITGEVDELIDSDTDTDSDTTSLSSDEIAALISVEYESSLAGVVLWGLYITVTVTLTCTETTETTEAWTLDDTAVDLDNYGITYEGEASDGDTITVAVQTEDEEEETAEAWTLNDTQITLEDYGITYEGEATDGDTIIAVLSITTSETATDIAEGLNEVYAGTLTTGDDITLDLQEYNRNVYLETKIETVETELENYLPLEGNSEDTPVTGTIYISKGNGNIINYHDTDLNATDMETPSSDVYPMGIYCYDTDDYLCGAFELAHTTDNQFHSQIYSRRIIDGTQYMATLKTVCDEDGNCYANAPASAASGSILVTSGITKARVGYLKLGNGIIINWGYCSTDSAGDSVTVTYATSFSGTSYNNIAVAQIRSSAGSNAYPTITSRTASTVTIKGDSSAVNMFIAIGY